VKAWLEQNRIAYAYFKDVTGDHLGQRTMPEIAGLDYRDLSGMIRVTYDGKVNLLIEGDIDLYFFFDADDRLVAHLITTFGYYP
jgi:hypothetical protein